MAAGFGSGPLRERPQVVANKADTSQAMSMPEQKSYRRQKPMSARKLMKAKQGAIS